MIATSTKFQQALQAHERGELSQAAALYRQVISEQPGNADARHLLGVTALQQGDDSSAIESIRSALSLEDGIPLYHSNLGAALRESGDVAGAIAAFRRAVELDPQFSGGHYNLGLALEHEAKFDEAARSLQRAVEIDRRFVDASLALGRVLTAAGRAEEAVACLEAALEFSPQHAELQFSLGNALEALDRTEQAVESYRKAIRLAPRRPELHNNLGAAFQKLEQWDEAETCFQQAVELDPENIDAAYNLAGIRERAGVDDSALDDLQRILELQPDNVDVRCTLGKCLEQRDRFAEAEEQLQTATQLAPERVDVICTLARIVANRDPGSARQWCQRALQIDPDSTAALNTMGVIHFDQREYDDAEDCFRSALTIDPEDAIACYNLGNIYKDQWRLEDAIDHYDRAIELHPAFTQAHVNRGVVLKFEGRLDEAIDSYSQALAFVPDDAEARFHRALARLMQGDFASGWDEYESRWDYEAPPLAKARLLKAQRPLSGVRGRETPSAADQEAGLFWAGESLQDRSLLVYAEQGIGDEIMFASCLQEVVEQSRQCVIECDRRLTPIFARSFPLAHVIPHGSEQPDAQALIGDCDVQIAIGSLPRYLRRNADDFPARRRYLAADPALVRKEARLLRDPALRDDAPKSSASTSADQKAGLLVGISWRGGNKPGIRRRRSTSLDDWQPLLELPDVQFVNLQYGDCRDEIAGIAERLGVTIYDRDDCDPLTDLDGFAARIAALDLVISVDNSTVHMAGALGVPVFTLLPFAPNWRWQLGRDDSPWYPSMRLFRQPEPECWAPVFKRVAAAVRGFPEQRLAAETGCRPIHAKKPGISQGRTTAPGGSEIAHSNGHGSKSRASVNDEEADHERRKYEHVWTHDAYRINSPGLADAEKVGLVEELRKRNCRTVLDAGCGSGKLLQKLMTEHAGEFDVHGFDISDNCLDPFFDDIKNDVLTVGCLWNADEMPGEYDAVICTDVLEHVPTERVPDVLANLRRCTRKFAYLAIALFPDGFGPKLLGEPLHLTVQPPNWWFAKLGIAGFRIEGHAVERDANGTDLWLHVFLGV